MILRKIQTRGCWGLDKQYIHFYTYVSDSVKEGGTKSWSPQSSVVQIHRAMRTQCIQVKTNWFDFTRNIINLSTSNSHWQCQSHSVDWQSIKRIIICLRWRKFQMRQQHFGAWKISCICTQRNKVWWLVTNAWLNVVKVPMVQVHVCDIKLLFYIFSCLSIETRFYVE